MVSNLKSVLAATLAAATAVSAHSWLECIQHDNSQILDWMKGNSTLTPPVQVDPTEPRYADFCHGWPRGKANPGNWIDESTNLVWNIAAESWDGGDYHPPDTSACPVLQRSPGQLDGAPMAEIAPGGMLRLRFGGNGHARGSASASKTDPGIVSVYWKGTPETEITDISEFTDDNLLQKAGFSDNSFAYPADLSIINPDMGLVDKGNWMEITIPAGTPSGRHMLAWVWSYNDGPQWSSCFDINVTGGSYAVDPDTDSSAAASTTTKAIAPIASVVSSVVAVVATTPAAVVQEVPAVTAAPIATATTYTTEWSTVTAYVKNKRVHAREF